MDIWTWVTGLFVAAHIIVITGMIIHAAYLRRKERFKSSHASVRRRG